MTHHGCLILMASGITTMAVALPLVITSDLANLLRLRNVALALFAIGFGCGIAGALSGLWLSIL